MRIKASTLKAVAAGASADQGRYAFPGVRIETDRIVTTDGRMLLAAKIETDTGEHVTPRTVTMESIEAILREPRTRRTKMAEMASNGTLTYQGNAGSVPAVEIARATAEFPDTRGILRERVDGAFRICFGPELLAKIAKAAKAEDADDVVMEFDIGKDGKPSSVGGVRLEIGDVTGIVMPRSL